MTFYTCPNCNQTYIKLGHDDVELTCCGQKVETVLCSRTHADDQDHVPIIRKTGNFVTITIGESHPMVDVHRIEFICLETNRGFQYRSLDYNKEAKAEFILGMEEEIVNVYTYCNVHFLWSLK